MSAISPAEPRPRPQPSVKRDGQAKNSRDRPSLGLQVIDVTLVSLFLALTFLLGIFPLKDADYFWHLRTGDLIRKTGEIPRVDFYTFTRQGTPWIDLHWIFQVGISWLNEHGGVPALTLAKSAITCLAVLLLITARRRSWPIWAMVLAWLPALLVLSGRMYVRPETLSLLYLAVLPGRHLSLGPVPAAGLAAADRAGGLGQFPGPVRAGTDLARLRPGRRGLAPWRFRPGAQAMVADRRPGLRRHRIGLLAEPLWNSWRHLSPRAGRDDEQPHLLAEHRRADANPGLHQKSGVHEPAASASLAHDGARRPELCDSRVLARLDATQARTSRRRA